MYQCCGCDKLFSSLKAVRQHITSSVKTNPQSRTYSATGRAVRAGGQADRRARGAPGPPAAPDSESELQYFHRGLHRLRGPGPGYRIVILSRASEGRPLPVPSRTASRAGSEQGAAAAAEAGRRRPEPLAGGTATLQEIFDPERVPAPEVVDSEADELSLPDLSRRENDSEDEPDDPGELKYCNIYCIQYP